MSPRPPRPDLPARSAPGPEGPSHGDPRPDPRPDPPVHGPGPGAAATPSAAAGSDGARCPGGDAPVPGGERLDWGAGGVPVSVRFGDPYFSLQGGLAETGHVFLAGNDLPARFRDGFRIAELGFGTGLNLLAACLAWGDRPGGFRYTSFEAFPIAPEAMALALDAFPQARALAAPLLSAWGPGSRRFACGPAEVEIVAGDARDMLPCWAGMADAWFLDGFSPAKNPELWGEALMGQVARHTAPGGTFATYTAAGHVRRALQAAGFEVIRAPGFGAKRHMSRGRLAERRA